MANPETLLGEIEAKTRELIGTDHASFHHESDAEKQQLISTLVYFTHFFYGFSQTDNTAVGVHQK